MQLERNLHQPAHGCKLKVIGMSLGSCFFSLCTRHPDFWMFRMRCAVVQCIFLHKLRIFIQMRNLIKPKYSDGYAGFCLVMQKLAATHASKRCISQTKLSDNKATEEQVLRPAVPLAPTRSTAVSTSSD
jgi:hypothetical protein